MSSSLLSLSTSLVSFLFLSDHAYISFTTFLTSSLLLSNILISLPVGMFTSLAPSCVPCWEAQLSVGPVGSWLYTTSVHFWHEFNCLLLLTLLSQCLTICFVVCYWPDMLLKLLLMITIHFISVGLRSYMLFALAGLAPALIYRVIVFSSSFISSVSHISILPFLLWLVLSTPRKPPL